jgi:hypothetical protein
MFAKSIEPPFPLLPRAERPSAVRISISVLALVFAAAFIQALGAGMTEGYCIVWPGIGTHFARDFSHLGFERIKPGMSEQQVIDLIGRPITRDDYCSPSGWPLLQRGDKVWSYSMDSSQFGGDWAWLSRQVVFRDGRVAQTVKWTFHD